MHDIMFYDMSTQDYNIDLSSNVTGDLQLNELLAPIQNFNQNFDVAPNHLDAKRY
jgi:hypothetical protein